MNKTLSYILLLSSFVCFVLGLYYPMISTKQQLLGFTLDYQEFRLYDSVKTFYENADYLLASVIFIFTIVVPIIKYFELLIRIQTQSKASFLNKIDKWSMIDVFIVALLLINFKMDANTILMKLKIGTYFLAVSVILRMITASVIIVKKEETKKHLLF